jgi:hypothetical protein
MGRRGTRIGYCWESHRKETTRKTKTRVNNIKMDLGEIWAGVDWIGLAQDRGKRRVLLNAIMNLRVP